jgi:KUP system potassium uptake protein
MPQWFLLTGVGIATLAAVVACQAVISGSFTLINEAITLNFWPRVRVKFPTLVRGQIYIPSVNWLLWAGCVGVMFYFRSSGNMEAAYGFFIVVAMLMTSRFAVSATCASCAVGTWHSCSWSWAFSSPWSWPILWQTR